MRLLVEVSGNHVLRQLELTGERYVLGRDPDCDIVFEYE